MHHLDKIDFSILLRGGHKAPFHVKNKRWIDDNVKEPFDYIQIDHEKLRIDLLEWGVTTQDFWNLWRLTPSVFRYKDSEKWIVKGELKYLVEAAKEENAKFCLDRALSLILKKQGHFDLRRYLSYAEDYGIKVKLKENSPLFKKASKDSIIIRELQKDEVFSLESITRGFDEEQKFGKVYYFQKDPPIYFSGYVSFESLERIKE